MKKTKLFLVSALIFAGLTFTGCNNGTSNGSGVTGGSGAGTEDTKVIQLSEDGKTVTIDYTNETEEEQKFLVFAGENLGYNFKGNFDFFNLDNSASYKFGMFFDYRVTNPNTNLAHCDLVELNTLGIKSQENNNYLQYNFFISNTGSIVNDFMELNFDKADTVDSVKTENSAIRIKDKTSLDIEVKLEDGAKKPSIYSRGTKLYSLLDKTTDPTKFGYFLIIPAGSTCHLKLTISYL